MDTWSPWPPGMDPTCRNPTVAGKAAGHSERPCVTEWTAGLGVGKEKVGCLIDEPSRLHKIHVYNSLL